MSKEQHKPSEADRRGAVERGVQREAEHERKKGNLPNMREITNRWTGIAEKWDRKKDW